MFSNDKATDYLERADMHEHLAATTDDVPARKMHLAMAAEFRRKAQELNNQRFSTLAPSNDVTIKLDVVAR